MSSLYQPRRQRSPLENFKRKATTLCLNVVASIGMAIGVAVLFVMALMPIIFPLGVLYLLYRILINMGG